MKLKCNKTDLERIIYLSERLTGRNLSLPILSNILLEVKNKRLTVKATNLDMGIELNMPVVSEKDGAAAINPYVLNNFLNNLKNEEKIEIILINNNLTITTKTSSTIIKSEPIDDFPTIPSIKKGNFITIPVVDLILGLQSVFFAAATSDIKPEISSVYIYEESDYLYFVATDSFRLAEKKILIKGNKNNFNQVIIPLKNVIELIRIFNNLKSEVTIYADTNQISFYADDIYLTSRLIDGTYPDYRQIIPKKFKTEIKVKKDDINQSLKLAMVFLNKLNQIRISTHNETKSMEINSQNQDIGENTVTIPIQITGEEIIINLNAKYLADTLPPIASDFVKINFSNRPIFIQGENDNSFFYLIMPLNR